LYRVVLPVAMLAPFFAGAQDSARVKVHSPRRATLYSAVLPGLGQAYNKKYWKIPVIYAGFGTFAYMVSFNAHEYDLFRDAYNHKTIYGDLEPPVNDYEARYTTEALKSGKDYYRRNRDLDYILASIWYVLNVIDATVDAHLFDWEVGEDLAISLRPGPVRVEGGGFPAGGITLSVALP
jgi:hypothetical protein